MRSLIFEGKTWRIYEKIRREDKKLHAKICQLIEEMLRSDPRVGSGKPEQLKYNLSGLWSRRISARDRLVYEFDDDYIYIIAIGGHYVSVEARSSKS